MSKELKTLCPYCGVGCGLLATTDGQRITRIRPDPKHPANLGRICLKGASVGQTVNVPNRLRHAMLREGGHGPHVVPVEAAVRFAAEKLERILQTDGPNAIAFYLSGQMTTEAQYLFNKFAKGYLRTNHVDSNSRLCMSGAAAAMTLSVGSDGPPTCYSDIELADTFLFIGSNAADCHPVVFERVERQIKKHGARSVVVDPRKTKTAASANLFLPVKPGTDLALLNGIMRLLRDWGAIDPTYIADHTDGWAELSQLLDDYPADTVAATCGIHCEDLIAAAKIIAEGRRLITFWTMGVNQTVQGVFTGNAIMNLHLATGRIGKPGCGPFSLTGQPNAMGGRDVGYMSHLLPGQRLIANPEHRKQIEQLWGIRPGTIHSHAGYDSVALFDAIHRGEIKAIWIVGTNPAASMPNNSKVREALTKAELVIVQDAYFPTETTKFAHVLLPAAINLEQSGTFCNSERRVTLMEQVVPPPGDAKPDWWWCKQIAAAMGFTQGLSMETSQAIFDEFSRVTAGRPNDQSALSHELLRKKGPQQWPYPALGSSAARRFTDGKFATANGRAKLWARPHVSPEERPSREFPLMLIAGRIASQWHTRTKTGNVTQLNKLEPEPTLSMHPEDAKSRGLENGQRVNISSRRGKAWNTLRIDPTATPGVVFASMHWNDLWAPGTSANEVTSDATDPISKQPGIKTCAVDVKAFKLEIIEDMPRLVETLIAGADST